MSNELSRNSFLHQNSNLRQLITFLFAVQLVLIAVRFLTLFQNTKYLGSLLKIITKMLASLVKLFAMIVTVIIAFTFGFYFIFGIAELELEDDTPTVISFRTTFMDTLYV